MGKKRRISFQHTGLEIATFFGRFFMDSEDLHFGYWTKDLQVKAGNFKQAQTNYTDFILDHIPDGIKTILDAGAGNGNLSQKLMNNDYNAEALTPSSYQTDIIKKKLGDDFIVHLSRFESCTTLSNYDLIIFSESFQYIPIKKAITKAISTLNDNGYILICDFFNKPASRNSAFKGGHNWERFSAAIKEFPLMEVLNIDITKETAPNVFLFAGLINDVGFPSATLINQYLSYKYPRLMSFINWKFKNKFSDINNRYNHDILNKENYLKSKTYRLLLFKKA